MANPILRRLRERFDRTATQAVSRARELAGREAFSFSAEIPGWKADEPLWRIKLEMLSEEREDGGRLRFRAHVQSRIASAVAALPNATAAQALPAPDAGRTLAPAERAAELLRRTLEVPALRRAAGPLLRHDIDSWVEIRASTADLVDGARALLPEREQLKALGIEPAMGSADAPLAQTWAGATPGARPGYAQVSLLQVDKRHLPASVAALLGGRPFQLVAAVVNVAEDKAR